MWLWSSATGVTAVDVDRRWQAFLRRFDLEHTFRLFKQTLGWTVPRIRAPQAADRWTWLVIAAYTQLRLARPLAADLRRPWEKPALPGHRPGSDAGFGTSAHTSLCLPAHRNSPDPVPDAHQGRRTPHRQSTTTSEKPAHATAP
jgi:hypothetical protein